MKKYFILDHKILFFIGYAFYLFTPFLIGFTDLFTGYPGIDLFKSFFELIPENKLRIYFIISILWLPAFYMGHLLFKLLKPYKISLAFFKPDLVNKNIGIISALLFTTLVLFIFLGRNSLFHGYSSYDTGVRGKFSTLLVVYNFFLIYQLIVKQKPSLLFISGLAITLLLLLSMGGRMYVFQTFVVLLVYKTSFADKRLSFPIMLIMLTFFFFIGALSGIWRMGENFTLVNGSYSFIAEPVFTWFSTSSFLAQNEIPLFNVPLNFLTSFFNLVPNTIVSLQPYVISTQSMGFITQSPLGADSIWSNIVINFGAIGSFFFIMFTGFILNVLRSNAESSKFGAVYYIMVCGMIPFQLFRDGFYLLNKQLFFNFLILPGIILFAFSMIKYLTNHTKYTTISIS